MESTTSTLKSTANPTFSEEELDRLHDIIGKKSGVIQSQKARIDILEGLLSLQKRQNYGSSSEKQIDQLNIFDEVEVTADEDNQSEPKIPPKKKKPTGRKGLNANIPRIQERIELSEKDKEGAIDTFFVKVKEQLDIVPPVVRVIETLQEKAVFLSETNARKIISAELPKHPLPKAVATTNTLAYIITAKYQDALPLYRLENILKRYGGSVTRTTLANWMIKLSDPLYPLINLIREHQCQGELIQADETRVQVLKEPGKSATGDKWMWLTRGGPPNQPSVLFEYDPSRSQEIPLRLLEGFSGYLQTDGYAGYNAVVKKQELIQVGCFDHARRKFVDADKAAMANRKEKKGKTKRPPTKARTAISKIDKLYLIERKIKDETAEEKYLVRQKESIPLLNKLKIWLDDNQDKAVKNSQTWRAIQYTLNQWPKLIRYCDSGILSISNILAENAIRPFCIGRKNWLFHDSPQGAKASALYYSLIETAKANGLEPYDYFRFILKQLPYADTVEKLEMLLPWHINPDALVA